MYIVIYVIINVIIISLPYNVICEVLRGCYKLGSFAGKPFKSLTEIIA